TFGKLIRRHENLRTSFEVVNEEPVQRVHEPGHIDFSLEELETRAHRDRFVRPFDLSRAPLMRAALFKQDPGRFILMIDLNHIVTDGASQRLLGEEFLSLHQGETLPPLKLQYKDYSQWQSSQMESSAMVRQEEYWLGQFRETPPLLNLPLDYPRGGGQGSEGGIVAFAINREETRLLNQLALNEGATLYMILLALYKILLARICFQEDIIVGTPIAGRRHTDLQRIIGMFVNVITLRTNPHGDKTFTTFLSEVKEKTLKAFENQDYPFDTLVERLPGNRDSNRNPVAETVLVWQTRAEGQDPTGSGKVNDETRFEFFEIKSTKMDLAMVAREKETQIRCQLHYMKRLFKPETVEKFARYFKSILQTVLNNPQIKLHDIQLVTQEEKNRIEREARRKKDTFSRFKEENFDEDF
ncbi:MAG: non-ribosomal peptide synthetase, partial [bacterium]|nr:non-ribosomal peptide synthetase [bacterium]